MKDENTAPWWRLKAHALLAPSPVAPDDARERRRRDEVMELLGALDEEEQRLIERCARDAHDAHSGMRFDDKEEWRGALLHPLSGVESEHRVSPKAWYEAENKLLDEVLTTFYSAIAEHYDSAGVLRNRIQQLSRQLVDELGATGARALAQQLMAMTRGTR